MTGILHHWPLDPFSRQVRLALSEKALPFQLETVTVWSPPDTFVTLNPLRSTPVWQEGDFVAVGARAIMEYAEESGSPPDLMPVSVKQRARVRSALNWFDDQFNVDVNATLLFEKLEKRFTGAGAPDPNIIRQGRDALRWHLNRLGECVEVEGWLAGERLTLADLGAAAHLSCIDYFGDVPWDAYPTAKDWYARLKSRPSFRAILEDRLPGMAPATHYDDLDF